MNYGQRFMTLYKRQESRPSPRKRNARRQSGWGFANSWEKKRSGRKGETEGYTQLNAEFQRIAKRDKKAFLCEQCREIEDIYIYIYICIYTIYMGYILYINMYIHRDQTHAFMCLLHCRQILYHCTTWEAHIYISHIYDTSSFSFISLWTLRLFLHLDYCE